MTWLSTQANADDDALRAWNKTPEWIIHQHIGKSHLTGKDLNGQDVTTHRCNVCNSEIYGDGHNLDEVKKEHENECWRLKV